MRVGNVEKRSNVGIIIVVIVIVAFFGVQYMGHVKTQQAYCETCEPLK